MTNHQLDRLQQVRTTTLAMMRAEREWKWTAEDLLKAVDDAKRAGCSEFQIDWASSEEPLSYTEWCARAARDMGAGETR